jgi:CBS domain-containing protein
MDNIMKVSNVMTRRVISVTPGTSVVAAIRLMLKNKISGLPVIEKHRLVGMVTEGELLRRKEIGTGRKHSAWYDAFFGSAESAAMYVRTHGLKVKDAMSRQPVSVSEATTLDGVVRLMERHGIKRLPVVRKRKVVGIVSRADLMRAVVGMHRSVNKSPINDSSLRRKILANIRNQSWAADADIDVAVRKGVVDAFGKISDAAQRAALIALIENTLGTVRVEDHLLRREAARPRTEAAMISGVQPLKRRP